MTEGVRVNVVTLAPARIVARVDDAIRLATGIAVTVTEADAIALDPLIGTDARVCCHVERVGFEWQLLAWREAAVDEGAP